MRLLAALFLSLLMIPAAQADDTSDRMQVATDIIALANGDALLEQVTASVWAPMEKMIRAHNPKVDDATLAQLRGLLKKEEKVSVANLVAPMAKLYAAEFSLSELNDILTFYRSPAGNKMLEMTPKIIKEVTPEMINQQKKMVERLTADLKQAAKQKGLDL